MDTPNTDDSTESDIAARDKKIRLVCDLIEEMFRKNPEYLEKAQATLLGMPLSPSDAASLTASVREASDLTERDLKDFVARLISWAKSSAKRRSKDRERFLLVYYAYYAFKSTQEPIDLRPYLREHVGRKYNREFDKVIDENLTSVHHSIRVRGRKLAEQFREDLIDEERARWSPLLQTLVMVGVGGAIVAASASAAAKVPAKAAASTGTTALSKSLAWATAHLLGLVLAIVLVVVALLSLKCVLHEDGQNERSGRSHRSVRLVIPLAPTNSNIPGSRPAQTEKAEEVKEAEETTQTLPANFQCDLRSIAEAVRGLDTQDCGKTDNSRIPKDAATLTPEQKCALSAYRSGREFLLRVQYHSRLDDFREDLFVAQRVGDGLKIYQYRLNTDTFGITLTECSAPLDSVTDWTSRGCLRGRDGGVGEEICPVRGRRGQRE